jgi:hypothetical protein
MKRFILAPSVVLLCWLGFAAVPAAAQNTYPYMPPRYGPGWTTPLSPYLNMLIPGNPAVNYFGLTQPLFQQRQFANQTTLTLQGILNQYPPSPEVIEGEEAYAPLNATGHPTAINYTGSYFSTLLGQPYTGVGSLQIRRTGVGMAGAGRGAMGMGGMGGMMGMGGMGGMMGMGGMGMGGGGMWPNTARPGMGPGGR